MNIGHYIVLLSLAFLPQALLLAQETPQPEKADYSSWRGAYTASESDEIWQSIRQQYFQERPIKEGNTQNSIRLDTPSRAENDAQVPISIYTQLAKQQQISKIYLVVDVNPAPMGGIFTLPSMRTLQKMQTRVRVNGYTYIRAILETADGELYMDKQWVKSTGAGCSAPPTIDQEAHRKRLGKIRFKMQQDNNNQQMKSLSMLISHPNNTGMQRDQLSTLLIPQQYVKEIKVEFNESVILLAETSFTLSENPSFSFTFAAAESGLLKASITDSLGKTFVVQEKVTASLPNN